VIADLLTRKKSCHPPSVPVLKYQHASQQENANRATLPRIFSSLADWITASNAHGPRANGAKPGQIEAI
jgi:hypothetical protein